MRIVFFVHSAVSDWNHGNAHFLRGLMDALARRGHEVAAWEPKDAWSVENLVADHGVGPVIRLLRAFPDMEVETYDPASADLPERLAQAVAGADAVVVHEWNDPRVVEALGRLRGGGDRFALLFHDTHHRAVSDPSSILRFDLDAYDGALVFGESLRSVYLEAVGVSRAWAFHEAADVPRFRPLEREKEHDVTWIGNWGDGERTEELRRFWLDSARALPELEFLAHGVRYPAEALAELREAGVRYEGWVESLRVPEVFARSRTTLHVPRRLYRDVLHGIPTIRVFEALACGIPLVSTPWRDVEGLFRPGDFVQVETPEEMRHALRRLATDPDAAGEQAQRGLETIRARHTCDHRAGQLLEILATLGSEGADARPPSHEEVACV